MALHLHSVIRFTYTEVFFCVKCFTLKLTDPGSCKLGVSFKLCLSKKHYIHLAADAPPPFSTQQNSALDSTTENNLLGQDKRLSIELSSSFKVMVWKADLITFVADTIVNAANENLQHYGGLALPLCKAGGQDIVEESDLHIQKHGRLKTGEAIVTNAGNLPCKKIIHAVGPRVKKNPSHGALCRARKTLTKTVKNILQRVKELNLQSVAIAAISSGISNFPLPLCADIIVSTVKDFYEQKVHPHQLVVHLVNNDEPSVKHMERACKDILGATTSEASLPVSEQIPKNEEDQVGGILITEDRMLFYTWICNMKNISQLPRRYNNFEYTDT
uniref:Macro domain-containing protein n=1 Tax=Labrus bergylta TaxID=56723 RepID=A0A3Q3F6A5_9LABR